jgi:hypothetical protein
VQSTRQSFEFSELLISLKMGRLHPGEAPATPIFWPILLKFSCPLLTFSITGCQRLNTEFRASKQKELLPCEAAALGIRTLLLAGLGFSLSRRSI